MLQSFKSFFVTLRLFFRVFHGDRKARDGVAVPEKRILSQGLERSCFFESGINSIDKASPSAEDTAKLLSCLHSCRVAVLEPLGLTVNLEILFFEERTVKKS